MEPQVIEVTHTAFTPSRKYRILCSIAAAVFWTVGMMVWGPSTMPPELGGRSQLWIWLGWVPYSIGGLLFGLVTYFMTLRQIIEAVRPIRTKIIVGVDEVTVFYQTAQSKSWKWKRTVRKDRVRSIFKVRDGFGASERSKIGARMWGFVAIQNTFPEFEELKALLESWRMPEARP